MARKAKKAPVCLSCYTQKARRLGLLAGPHDARVFCSRRCAAIYGLRSITSEDIWWCDICGEWHEDYCPNEEG